MLHGPSSQCLVQPLIPLYIRRQLLRLVSYRRTRTLEALNSTKICGRLHPRHRTESVNRLALYLQFLLSAQ